MSQRGSSDSRGTSNGHNTKDSADTEQTESNQGPPGREDDKTSPRKPKSERENVFDFGTWLLEGLVGLNEELRYNDLGLPEEFWVHAYAARKETLLAARVLVDAALEHCNAEENKAAKTAKKPPKRGQVSIDFG